MATWPGWETQLLAAAGLPTSAANRQFLDDWAAHANRPNCARNPVDISHKAAGSSNCGSLPSGRTAQRFASHASAAGAFAAQLTATAYSHLHRVLAASNPYDSSMAAGVALDLQKWGSTKFQQAYIAETGIGSGVGGTGGASSAPHATKAWGDLQTQVNRTLPSSLRRVGGLQAATSTALRRHRRVRH